MQFSPGPRSPSRSSQDRLLSQGLCALTESCSLELRQAVRSFLGFSMIIKRTLPDHPLASDLKLRSPAQGLPIKFFWYEPLQGARSEHDFFVAERGAIDMDGPWPVGDLSKPAVIDQLSRHLFDPGWTLDGHPRTIPDQIHHFACHCDTSATSSRDYAIMLSRGESTSYRIRLSDLVKSVSQLIGTNPPVQVSLPLIFMNACGSSVIDPSLRILPKAVPQLAQPGVHWHRDKGTRRVRRRVLTALLHQLDPRVTSRGGIAQIEDNAGRSVQQPTRRAVHDVRGPGSAP